MKLLTNISLFFIYIVLIFGIIDFIPSGIKPVPRSILSALIFLFSCVQLFNKERNSLVDLSIVVFALLLSPGIFLFAVDIIFPPVAIANDCRGYRPSRAHFYDIILIGLGTTLILGILFLKTHTTKRRSDNIFSIIILLVLILCYLKVSVFTDLNNRIDHISTPKILLPKGC